MCHVLGLNELRDKNFLVWVLCFSGQTNFGYFKERKGGFI